jgi:outer membrane receptor protein involved in Fe transport
VHQQDFGSVADNTNAYALGPPPYTTYYNLSDQTFEDKAVFANFDLDFTDQLTGHVAARYTKSSIDFGGCTGDFGDGQLAGKWNAAFGTNVPAGECITLSSSTFQPGLATSSLDEDNTAWRVGLDWKPADALMLYGNLSRGYKSGSFPNLSGSTSDQYRPVTQESVDAYEVGFKYTSPERTLRMDGAVFYYDYKDKQVRGRLVVPVFGPLEGLVNLPKSTIKGAELQVTWIPVHGLTMALGASYIDSEIGSFTNYDPYGRNTDFTGESFPLTPEWQGFADLQYEWEVGESLLAFAGVNVSYQGSTNGALGNLDDFEIDAYTLVDLRAGVETSDGKWRVSLYGRNVTDEYYWTLSEHISDTNVRFTGMPTTYGISVAYRYN